MIIEDEHDSDAPIEIDREVPPLEVDIEQNENIRFQDLLARFRRIKDQEAHFFPKNALTDHLWEKYMFSASS